MDNRSDQAVKTTRFYDETFRERLMLGTKILVGTWFASLLVLRRLNGFHRELVKRLSSATSM